MVKIIIGGDFVPTESNFDNFTTGNIENVIDKNILNRWFSADCRIFNLETPLCDSLSPIKKCGPNLSAPTSTVKGIKQLKPDAVCVANNHIMDQGETGLKTTLDILRKNGINTTGGGVSCFDARKECVLKVQNVTLGLYCCAEHEFSIADNHIGGANPYDDFNTFLDIQNLKKKTDFVIVLYHGGREHYPYPSPALQQRCRKMADAGADAVFCQHSHCIGCREQWNNCEIVYGQGNFLFDYKNIECWNTSLLIEVDIKKDKIEYDYCPVVRVNNGIALANEIQTTEILNGFYHRSEEIKNPDFIKQAYQEEAQKYFESYVFAFCRRDKYAMINYLECEAHREIFLYALKNCNIPDYSVIKNEKPKKKFIGKVKLPNGRRKIYLFGFKIFSYKK